MHLLKYVITTWGLCACALAAQAQPGWTLDPAGYQYTMTIVAFLHVDGRTLTGEHDQVAAFAGGEVRGVASPIYIPSAGRYLAYLTVFANREDEAIGFRIYDSARDKVVDTDAAVSFRIDAQLGNVFQAFSVAHPALHNQAVLENFYFTGVDSVSTTIGDGTVTIVLEYDQDPGSLTPEFVISRGARMYLDRRLQESGRERVDFSAPVVYSVLSEDESVLNTYSVTVSNRETTGAGFACTNVITANDDGANDRWIVKDVFKYKDHNFRIADANGRILFESTGYNNDWNGYYKGARVERGKYYYVIKDPDSGTVINGQILVLY